MAEKSQAKKMKLKRDGSGEGDDSEDEVSRAEEFSEFGK